MSNKKILDNIPSKEWVDARNGPGGYLGGSEVAAALGESPWTTPFQLWLIKTGRREPVISTPVMELGHLLEPMISEKFTQATGLKLRNISEPYQHPEHSFLRGNIDRQICSSEKHYGPGVLEIKSTTSFRLKNEAGLYPEEWDFQIQHYLMLTGYEYAYLAIFERDTGIFHDPIYIERNEKLIQENTERIIQWWTLHILQDIAPDPINEDMKILYPDANDGLVVEASADDIAYHEELIKVRQKINSLQFEQDLLIGFIQNSLGEVERLVASGRDLVTWKNSVSNRLDTKALKSRYPALCKKFQKQTRTRRFVVKK